VVVMILKLLNLILIK